MKKNSKAAFKTIGQFVDGHYLAIYEALLRCGAMNPWQIAFAIRERVLTKNQISTEAQVFRRMSEMVKMGLVEKMDWDSKTPTGRYASVYWVKE